MWQDFIFLSLATTFSHPIAAAIVIDSNVTVTTTYNQIPVDIS